MLGRPVSWGSVDGFSADVGDEMHEMGIALEVARIARQEAAAQGAVRVLSVRLKVGGWSGVEPETLHFALQAIADPSSCDGADPLAGARFELELIPAAFRCPSCEHRYVAEGYLSPCPACGGLGGELVAGEELELAEIEVEDE